MLARQWPISMVLRSTIAPVRAHGSRNAMDQYKRLMAYDMARATTNAERSYGDHTPHPGSNMINELERLAKLKADGHLSDTEYQVAKANCFSI